jgi:hypothetical protein
LEELKDFTHTRCSIFTNIVCFSNEGEISLQDVLQTRRIIAVTFTRKFAVVAAVSVDL